MRSEAKHISTEFRLKCPLIKSDCVGEASSTEGEKPFGRLPTAPGSLAERELSAKLTEGSSLRRKAHIECGAYIERGAKRTRISNAKQSEAYIDRAGNDRLPPSVIPQANTEKSALMHKRSSLTNGDGSQWLAV